MHLLIPFALLISQGAGTIPLAPHLERSRFVAYFIAPSIDIWVKEKPINEVLKSVPSGVRIARTNFPLSGNVTARIINMPASAALNQVLASLGAKTYHEPTFPYFVIDRLDFSPPETTAKLITVDLTDTDIRVALRIFMKEMGYSYTVSTDLVGKVTIHAQGANPNKVLLDMLGQVGGSYRLEGGIFNFISEISSLQDAKGKLETAVRSFTAIGKTRYDALSRFARTAGISLIGDPDVDLDDPISLAIPNTTVQGALHQILGEKYKASPEGWRLRISRR